MAIITNTTVTTDLAPEITIDIGSRLVANYNKLREILGIVGARAVPEGTALKRYKTTVGELAEQVPEGEEIGLTKVTREPADPIVLEMGKYRKLVTAEAIQRSGRDVAINDTDEALVRQIRKDAKDKFFASLADGIGTIESGDFQATLANGWGVISNYYEDMDASPVFFVNPSDVADYLGKATITTQEAFGFDYVENFLGLGTAIFSAKVPAGTVYATAKENLNMAFIPSNGDVAESFELSYDETGLIGMTHNRVTSRASIETLIIASVIFYAEDIAGVFKGTIAQG